MYLFIIIVLYFIGSRYILYYKFICYMFFFFKYILNYLIIFINTYKISTMMNLQEEGKVDVLANEAGDRITPAVVSITDEETVIHFFFYSNKNNIVNNYF